MKNRIITSLFALILILATVTAQKPDKAALASGVNYIATKTYTAEEDAKILELYKDLRVADVSDGMDMVGLPGTGLVNPDIHASWVDLKDFKHVFRGIAVTVRYVPTQKLPQPLPGEDWMKWEGNFYNAYSHEGFTQILRPGSAVVIDDVEDRDIGSIGSNNILGWYRAGAVGVVTDAGARDTDEVGLEGVPLYLRKKGRGIRPGRNEIESVNRPVSIGGVLVCPGDVVVADGDGVIVVPRAVAEKVAEHANKVLSGDKAGRRSLYESLGRPLDKTVK
ncbi:MAG TPA: dimethylmenaquinone methyltransferase [Bacteroidales bacterium]|nr:dimethylmenaquinone methyltransferase [Bacteroidales bacterium]